jgi:hypothetical protein
VLVTFETLLEEKTAMPHSLAVLLVLLGEVLLLIPVLIVALLVIPTLHLNTSDRRDLGDLAQREARLFTVDLEQPLESAIPTGDSEARG